MKRVSYITARVAWSAAIVLLLASGIRAASPTPDIEVVPFGSFWKYLNPQNLNQDPFNTDNNFDDEWFLPGYDEHDIVVDDGGPVVLSWSDPVPSPIGYDVIGGLPNGLATDIGAPASGDRYTTYLRGVPFNRPAGVPAAGPFVMEFLADDGFAIHLDGEVLDMEVDDPLQARWNCCEDIGGVPVSQTVSPVFTDTSLATGNEDTFFRREVGIEGGTLSSGSHMIAVSLHQTSNTSSDTGFEMRLYVPGSGRPWGGDFSGDWSDAANWAFGVPTSQHFAVFDNAFQGQHTIWNDAAQTVDGIQIENVNTHNFAGTGSISLDGSLNVLSGDPAASTAGQHQFQVRVNLNSDTDAVIEDGSSVTFNNRLNLNGRTLAKTGTGDLLVRNTDNTGDGTINVVEGVLGGSGTVSGDVATAGGSIAPAGSVAPAAVSNTLTITGNANVAVGGASLTVFGNGDSDAISGGGAGDITFGAGTTINIAAAAGYTPADGDTAQVLLDWAAMNDSGATINAPGWNTDNLFVDGTVTFGSIIPPDDACDFNNDMACDIGDIDMLTAEIASGGNNLAFDIDGDGSITTGDRDRWLSDAGTKNGKAGAYLLGDANLDGAVNAQDLNELGQRWTQADSAWSHGDFTADGNVNAQDLNELGQRWTQVVPDAAAAASVVPEPTALSLLFIAALGLVSRRRRR